MKSDERSMWINFTAGALNRCVSIGSRGALHYAASMADQPHDMTQDILRAIQADLAEIKRRVGNIENNGATQAKHTAALVEGQANISVQLAEIEQRLDRLERRSGLIGAD